MIHSMSDFTYASVYCKKCFCTSNFVSRNSPFDNQWGMRHCNVASALVAVLEAVYVFIAANVLPRRFRIVCKLMLILIKVVEKICQSSWTRLAAGNNEINKSSSLVKMHPLSAQFLDWFQVPASYYQRFRLITSAVASFWL